MTWERRLLRNRWVIESDDPSYCHAAILAGVHGDERAGWFAFDKLIRFFQRKPLLRGRVTLMPGNLAACERKRPQRTAGGQDMNRLFRPAEELQNEGLLADGPDWQRSQLLAEWLRHVDALLDLHSTSSPSTPSACLQHLDPEHAALIKGLPVGQVIHGFDVLPGTTLAWMRSLHRRSVTVECGQHDEAASRGGKLAYHSALHFLQNLGMIEPQLAARSHPDAYLYLVQRGRLRDPGTFEYVSGFRTGTIVQPGELIGRDKTGDYRAPTAEQLQERLDRISMPASQPMLGVMVTNPQRVRQVQPHDAYLLAVRSSPMDDH